MPHAQSTSTQLTVDQANGASAIYLVLCLGLTVEVHLSHAYRKLGIGSRRELPAAVAAHVPRR